MPSSPETAAQRLFAFYQQALGHDLPNKLVALQGIARLVAEDASSGVAEETRHCLERVADLSRQIHGQIGALAEVGRALRQGGPLTHVSLEEAWNEWTREMACRYPQRSLRWERAPDFPLLQLPQRAFHRVFLELLHLLIRKSPHERPLALSIRGTQENDNRIRIDLASDAAPPSPRESETLFDPNLEAPEGPVLGPFLALLMVEGWGGSLRLSSSAEGGCQITLTVPQPIAVNDAGT